MSSQVNLAEKALADLIYQQGEERRARRYSQSTDLSAAAHTEHNTWPGVGASRSPEDQANANRARGLYQHLYGTGFTR